MYTQVCIEKCIILWANVLILIPKRIIYLNVFQYVFNVC